MIDWHIGCSGFHYKHWKGTFYPQDLAQSKWFDYYCQFFNTLELNVTFYRFPKLSSLENWRVKSPAGFRFAVKAPKAITHYKKFNGVTDLMSSFCNTTRDGLQEKLGCILFQLPPNFHYSEEHLQRIVDNLDTSFLNVVEFRHESWWIDDVFSELKKKNITFSGMSHPSLPKDIINNTSLFYYRMHGEGQLYASNYDNSQLQNLVDEIKSKKHVKEAYVYFNNDIHTYAVHNALAMLKMI
jgi:uncharacterized protein YecE (DUF72 family)